MTRPTTRRLGLAAVLLGAVGLLGAGKLLYDFGGTTWNFPVAAEQTRTQIQGISTVFYEEDHELELSLDDDGTWTILRNGTAFAQGLWTHPKPTKRSVRLELDPQGLDTLGQHAADIVEMQAWGTGIADADVLVNTVKARLRVKAKPDASIGVVTTQFRGSLKVTGTIAAAWDGFTVTSRPWKTRLKVKAASEALLLASIADVPVADPDTPVKASFVMGQSSGSAPLQVQFASTSTGQLTWMKWDYGDGNFQLNVPNPIHVYTTKGTYEVLLIIAGPQGVDWTRRNVVVTETQGKTMPLYPGIPPTGPPGMGILTKSLGPANNYYGLPQPGQFWQFNLTLSQPTDVSTFYKESISAWATNPQTLRTTLVLCRTSAGYFTTILPPAYVTVTNPGVGVYKLFERTQPFGPVLNGKPGDVLIWRFDNVSPPSPGDFISIHMNQSHIIVPAF